MTSITIRRLPAPTKEKLRLRAARAGLSLESYTRQVLQSEAEKAPDEAVDLAALAQACFGEEKGVELKLPPRGSNRPPISFA